MLHLLHVATVSIVLAGPMQAEKPVVKFQAREIDPHVGNVCYGVTLADVNADGKPDIVAVTENAVVWFENPSWRKRTIIENQTDRDNVCIAPYDIDGDGKIDFALGAGWPNNMQGGGTIQWLRRGASLDEKWTVHAISSEPTTHRMRWGDVLRTGRPQLVVSPLQGRGTKGPNWNEGNGLRLLAFSIPADPAKDSWPVEVIDDTLHTMHNHWTSDFDGDGYDDILTASWEGVNLFQRLAEGRWTRWHLGEGNQDTPPPNKGSSEIKPGKIADRKFGFIATIEPWHGHQVVVYTTPTKGLGAVKWTRSVIDDTLAFGHAVWTADLDGDGTDEIIIGQRDKGKGPIAGPGVFVFRAKNAAGTEWEKIVVDDGGVAVEDLVAGDLNGDGRIDIVAGGRHTHNVKLYENLTSDR